MNNIKKKIENEDFNFSKPFLKILFYFSKIYGFIAKLHKFIYKIKLLKTREIPAFVISIGNITSGGTGKTPMVIYLAQLLKKNNIKCAVVCKAYKAQKKTKELILSDGQKTFASYAEVGDEAFMLAKFLDVPIAAGKNRALCAKLLIKKFGTQVIILDDAFQHYKIKKDLELVLLDHTRPFSNNFLLPRGLLRQRPYELINADALIITRYKKNIPTNYIIPKFKKPTFTTKHAIKLYTENKQGQLQLINPQLLDKQKVTVFSGIAKNAEFHNTLRASKMQIDYCFGFSDHYDYGEFEIRNIENKAKLLESQYLLTTAKDYFKVKRFLSGKIKIIIASASISFASDPKRFEEFIIKKIKKA